MPISVACPSCHSRVRLPDNGANRRFCCPKCQSVFAGASSAPKRLIVRPEDEFDPELMNEVVDSPEGLPDQAPLPISAAARQARQERYNPFASSGDEDDDTPKKNRHRKSRGDYNPFVESPEPEVSQAGVEELFDFGAPDPGEGAVAR